MTNSAYIALAVPPGDDTGGGGGGGGGGDWPPKPPPPPGFTDYYIGRTYHTSSYTINASVDIAADIVVYNGTTLQTAVGGSLSVSSGYKTLYVRLNKFQSLNSITSLTLSNTYLNLLDLTYLPNVVTLDVSNNAGLSSIDISGVTLTSLDAGSTAISSIDKADLGSVTGLYLYDTPITTLDLGSLTALLEANFRDCTALASTTLTGCTGLQAIILENTAITSLNCSGLTNLSTLTLTDCSVLSDLNCDTCTGLATIGYTGVQLTGLSALSSGIITLENLDLTVMDDLVMAGSDGLITLPSGLAGSSIETIDVTGTAIDAVDVTGCASLTELMVANCTLLASVITTNCTSLTTLAVLGCTSLSVLTTTGSTSLASIDVTSLAALVTLTADDCALTSATLTGASAMTAIDMSSNSLDDTTLATIIDVVEAFGTSGGTLTLDDNEIPNSSSDADVSALRARSWTVTIDVFLLSEYWTGINGNSGAVGDTNFNARWSSEVAHGSQTQTITGDSLVLTSPVTGFPLFNAVRGDTQTAKTGSVAVDYTISVSPSSPVGSRKLDLNIGHLRLRVYPYSQIKIESTFYSWDNKYLSGVFRVEMNSSTADVYFDDVLVVAGVSMGTRDTYLGLDPDGGTIDASIHSVEIKNSFGTIT